MADWRNLPPVPEADRPALTDRASQTLLDRVSVCPRSAMLYLNHKGGPRSHPMDRGSCFHAFAAKAVGMLDAMGEHRMPPEVAKDLMQTCIDDPAYVVTPGEADRLRVMAYHFAQGFVIDPGSVLATETLFELELAGFRVRGKVDLLMTGGDRELVVRDWKSSLAVPSQEDFEGKLQLPLYALLVADGRPVRICDQCDGRAWLRVDPDDPDDYEKCEACNGRGGFYEPPLGGRADMFGLAELFPTYLWDEGMPSVSLGYRQRWLTKAELADHRLYVEGLLRKLRHALDTGDWPAVPGSQCQTCSAPHECPLPDAVKDVWPDDDRETAAARWLALDAETKELWKQLRADVSRDGPILLGSDLVLDFADVESRKTDYDGLVAAVENAVQFGEPFSLSDWIAVSHSSRFAKRKAAT